MNPRFSRFKDKHMMPGQTIEREVGTGPVPAEEEELRLKWYGTEDIPELIFPPTASYPAVTLPAGEASLLTRIAEVAEELTFPEKEKSMKKHMSEWYELVSLVSEWRQEWRKR